MKKLFVGALIILISVSCGDTTKDINQVQYGVSEGVEILKELPKIEEEKNKANKEASNKYITGFLKATVDGKVIEHDEWNTKNSRSNFFDTKANFFLKPLKDEVSVNIVLTSANSSIYGPFIVTGLAPTMTLFDFEDAVLSKQFEEGLGYLQYKNKTTGEEFLSAKGNLTIVNLSKNEIHAIWQGEAFQGDWRNRNLVPFEAEIHLNLNIVEDLRK